MEFEWALKYAGSLKNQCWPVWDLATVALASPQRVSVSMFSWCFERILRALFLMVHHGSEYVWKCKDLDLFSILALACEYAV